MLSLRAARSDDEARLLEWRNMASTRQASFASAEIAPEDHHRWFLSKLGDPGCLLLIIEEDGLPVGQIRLDRVEPRVAEISIGLAPEARGRGLGREALRLSTAEAHSFGVDIIKARVKLSNERSLAAFAAAGYAVVANDRESVELSRRSD
jgi:RimJ/RimL family protein N-acetyltransferase